MNEEKKREPVPCGECRLCCQRDMTKRLVDARRVVLLKHEWKKYEHRQVEMRSPSKFILGTDKEGTCLYLTEQGCSIHEDSPEMCQNFDCRAMAQQLSRQEVREMSRKLGNIVYRCWQRGRELLAAKGGKENG